MVAESMEHGHGHEAHKAPEGHKGSHVKWLDNARMFLMAMGVGILAMAAAPPVLFAAGLVMPSYLQPLVGMGAAAWYVKGQDGKGHKTPQAGSHAGH
jgi:hypothetical protein